VKLIKNRKLGILEQALRFDQFANFISRCVRSDFYGTNERALVLNNVRGLVVLFLCLFYTRTKCLTTTLNTTIPFDMVNVFI